MSDYSSQDPHNAQGDDSARVSCEAGELKVLLGRIADHIADADTRHGSTLREMHDRIVHLGEEAQSVRDTVPPALASAFARIEEGLADLAERIGDSAELPKTDQDDATEYPCATLDAWVRSDVGHGASDVDYWGVTDSMTGRSTVAARKDSSSKSQVDAHNPHWDHAAAEEFTRALEDGADDLDRSTQASSDPGHAHHTAFAGSSGTDHGPATRRLDDIASRLEHALSAIWPNGSVIDLESRFQSLEQRVSKALEGIATRADAEGLRLVEAQIADLAQHIESSQAQLVRLDSIERHLAQVTETLSGEKFANLLSNAPLSADDFEHLADTIAQRMQQRSNNAHVATVKLEELNGLIERFVSSYREADENTASALTTIQQAMVHLLDRFDPHGQPQGAWPEENEPVAPEDDFDVRSDGEALLARVYHHQARDHYPRGPLSTPELSDAPSHPADFTETAAELDEARTAARSASPPPMSGPTKPEAQAQELPATGEAAPDTRRQLVGTREEFVASARRAARQASSQPPLSGEAAPQPEKRSWFSSRRKSLGRPVAGLFLATIVVLVAVGVGMTTYSFIKTDGATATTPAHSLRIEDGSSSGANGERLGTQPTAAGSSEQPGDSHLIGDEPERETPPANTGPALPAGVLIETGSLSADELAQAQQRRAMAQTSTRLGAAQANIASIPTSLIPSDGERSAAGTAATAIGASVQPQSLPPASIGPLSLRIAAANGDPSAEFEVAARFAEGRGIQSDFTKAFTWYQRAASRGFAPAQYRLATLYEQGLGTARDLSRARVWYQSAAKKGNIKAMHNLAVLSAGRAPADYKTAAHWFTEAAERGVRDSQFNLAVLLESGYGVQADQVAAYKWFAIAAQGGDKEAPRRRDRIKTQLSAEDLKGADTALRGWRPKPIDHLVNDSRAAGEAWRRRENDPTAG